MNEIKNGVFRVLIKTDKHGNKTYRTNACKRCCGYGKFHFTNLQKGLCWDCNGTGIGPEYNSIEYSPEQLQLRLEKKRAKNTPSIEVQLRALVYRRDTLSGETFETFITPMEFLWPATLNMPHNFDTDAPGCDSGQNTANNTLDDLKAPQGRNFGEKRHVQKITVLGG